MADQRWRQILRIMNEAFEDYLTGLVALRTRAVLDLKRKLSDGKLLDPVREQPASTPRQPRARRNRPRGDT